MNIGLTRHFDAAHCLPNYDGKCANLHGHTYTVEVTVAGVPSELTGMVMDFNALKQVVDAQLDRWDHQYLNNFIGLPTAENMVGLLLKAIKASLKDNNQIFDYLIIRLYESPETWAEDIIDYED